MNEAIRHRPSVERLLKRVEREIASHRLRGPPSHNRPRENIDDEGNVNATRRSRYIREICHPELVGTTGLKVSLHEIRRSNHRQISLRRDDVCSAANRASETELPHETRDRATGRPNPLAVQLLPDLLCAVDGEVFLPDTHDLRPELLIAFRSPWKPLGIEPAGSVLVVSRRGVATSQIGSIPYSSRFSSMNATSTRSAVELRLGEKTEALRKISFARLSSRFSRSSALNFSRSSVVKPARFP